MPFGFNSGQNGLFYGSEPPTFTKDMGVNLLINRAVSRAKEEHANGVRETSKNNGPGIRKYKFGNSNNFNWCSFFANWSYGLKGNLFDLSNEDIGRSQKVRKAAQREGFFRERGSGYVPQKGDLIIWSKNDYEGHIGVVSEVHPDGSFVTIEGNIGNKVSERHFSSESAANRSMQGQRLAGFVDMHSYIKHRTYGDSELNLATNGTDENQPRNIDILG